MMRIGSDALFTTSSTSCRGRDCTNANAVTQLADRSSNAKVWGRSAAAADRPPRPLGLAGLVGLVGLRVMALMTSPGLRPALAAGEPGRTAMTWVVTGKHSPNP